jgi:hypothetical protein
MTWSSSVTEGFFFIFRFLTLHVANLESGSHLITPSTRAAPKSDAFLPLSCSSLTTDSLLQLAIYQSSVKPLVDASFSGYRILVSVFCVFFSFFSFSQSYNATVLAYGQTGSGKTCAMYLHVICLLFVHQSPQIHHGQRKLDLRQTHRTWHDSPRV